MTGAENGRARSRSPHKDLSSPESISRALCKIGRYHHKRPEGLHIDDSGAFSIKALMATWGRQHGVEEGQVLQAVQKYMFHEDGSELRFALFTDQAGELILRVMPSRGRGRHGGRDRGEPHMGGEPREYSTPAKVSQHRHRRSDLDGPLQDGWRDMMSASRRDQAPLTRAEKLDMPLGDVVRAEAVPLQTKRQPPLPSPFAPPQQQRQDKSWQPAHSERHQERQPPQEWPPQRNRRPQWDWGASEAADAAKQLTAKEKLDMPLSSVISNAALVIGNEARKAADKKDEGAIKWGSWWSSSSWSGNNNHNGWQESKSSSELTGSAWEKRERLQHACKQMGWTEDSRAVRLRGNHGGGGDGRSNWEGTKRREDASTRQKLKRWLSWVFKAGHQELRIELTSGGAVRLEEVSLAMPKSFGQFDGPKLRTCLEAEGLLQRHFEISGDGLLRKLARRKEKKTRARSRSGSEDGARWRRRPSRSRSLSSSSSAASEACIGKAPPALVAASATAPPPPPGDGWTLYKDEDTLWWHYTGSASGEWWCEDGGKTPKPYNADE